MKKLIIIGVLGVFVLFFMFNEKTGNNQPVVETYPWQITVLANGRTRVFGIVMGETTLAEVNKTLKSKPTMALFEENGKMSLEAYYKSISLGGMIGSFILSLDASEAQFNRIKQDSMKQKRAENNGIRYELDKPASDSAKYFIVKNLIYIPTAQLDEDIIIKRFGQPQQKIKLKNKEAGWHYLYPEKGLDLIYKEEGKEVLQYVLPKHFNALLEPLQSH